MAQEAAIPASLWGRVQKMIDDSIAKFARSGFLRNARISGGAGLTIADGGQFRAEYPADLGGGVMASLGRIVNADTGEYLGTGLLLQNPDGTDIAQFRTDAATGTTRAHINDGQGNSLFSSDRSGQGIGRPYLAGGFAARRFTDFRFSTTAAEFETLCDQVVTKQQPGLLLRVRASMDTAGTTGELRVLVNDVPFGPPATVGFAVATRLFGPLPVAGAHMSDLTVEIQGRRTSGTGTLRVEPMNWKGRDTL